MQSSLRDILGRRYKRDIGVMREEHSQQMCSRSVSERQGAFCNAVPACAKKAEEHLTQIQRSLYEYHCVPHLVSMHTWFYKQVSDLS